MKYLNDFYCAGYFGRRYDLHFAEVIAESDYSITVRTELTEEILTATFSTPGEKNDFSEQFISQK